MSKQPTALSQGEVRAVLEAYDVGKVLFTRPGAGTANPAVIVVTARGQFFLKRRNPRYSARGQLLYDHAVIRRLARAGLPVTPPQQTISGSRWQEHDGQVYELYPLVEGEQHEDGNLRQVEAAGRVLGDFHLATREFSPGGDKPLPRFHDPQDSLRGLRWARDQLAAGRRSPHGDLELVRRLIEAAEAVRRRLPDEAYRALPQCIVHGDYHPANLKFEGDEVVGIFDFDWVGRAPRMVDVADGFIYFCGRRARPVEPGDIASITQAFTLDMDAVAAFARGYGAKVSVTPQERAALPDLVRARWLFSRVDAMERKMPQDRKLDYLLEDIEAPLAEIDRLEEMLARGRGFA